MQIIGTIIVMEIVQAVLVFNEDVDCSDAHDEIREELNRREGDKQ